MDFSKIEENLIEKLNRRCDILNKWNKKFRMEFKTRWSPIYLNYLPPQTNITKFRQKHILESTHRPMILGSSFSHLVS